MIPKAIEELQRAIEREPESRGPKITPNRQGQLREKCNEAGQLMEQCLQPTAEECATFQKLWGKLLRGELLEMNDLNDLETEQREEKIDQMGIVQPKSLYVINISDASYLMSEKGCIELDGSCIMVYNLFYSIITNTLLVLPFVVRI